MGAKAKLLNELPNEILQKIFSYLSPKTVVLTIAFVCKKFHFLTSDETYWRRRLAQNFVSVEYPECTVLSKQFTYQRACFEAEHEYLKWSRYQNTFHYALLESGHFASVDAVHLLQKNNLCISGSRDRNLCLWDLTNMDTKSDSRLHSQSAAHHGWIWSISSLDDSQIFTGSWDQTVGQWQLTPTGLSHILRMKCTTAVLSVVAEYDLVIAGTFGSRIVLFDRRADSQLINSLNIHGRAVLSVATNGNYLYSCGEDKFVYCLDRRMWTVVCRARLNNYGMSLSLSDDQLWVSDSNGNIHLFDSRSEKFGVLNTISVEPKRRITDIKHNLGSVVCLTADKTLRAYTGGLYPRNIARINLPSDATKMSINNGTIACGFTDGTVGIWQNQDNVY